MTTSGNNEGAKFFFTALQEHLQSIEWYRHMIAQTQRLMTTYRKRLGEYDTTGEYIEQASEICAKAGEESVFFTKMHYN